MIQGVLKMDKPWLFGQSIVIMYETSLINKVYVLICITMFGIPLSSIAF